MATANDTSKPSNVPRIRVPIISFTVLVAVLYILGFLALLVPIYRNYDLNLETALQAVSEVSRTVVIGQGIIAFVGPFLLLGLVFLMLVVPGAVLPLAGPSNVESNALLGAVLKKVSEHKQYLFFIAFFLLLATTIYTWTGPYLAPYVALRDDQRPIVTFSLASFGLGLTLFIYYYVSIGPPNHSSAAGPSEEKLPEEQGELRQRNPPWLVKRIPYVFTAVIMAMYTTLFAPDTNELEVFVFAALAAVVMLGAVGLIGAAIRTMVATNGVTDASELFLITGIVLAIVAIALAASPAAVLENEPLLPSVCVVATEGEEEETSCDTTAEGNITGQHGTTVTGILLGHSDGSWHILTKDGITAVPTEKVVKAEVQ